MYSQNPPCFQWWQHLLWPITPHSMGTSQSNCKPVWWWLSFSTSDNKESATVHIFPSCSTSSMPPQNPLGFAQQTCYKPIYTMCDDLEEDEEDFQTVPLDENHRTTEEIPDRHLCIHEHSVPHSLCPYPCPYMDYTFTWYNDTLDLSDISEFEDFEDIQWWRYSCFRRWDRKLKAINYG